MTRLTLQIAGVCAFVGVAAAQPVYQRAALDPFWEAARSGRVDVVTIGDSNVIHFGDGWDAGWTLALGERFGTFASPLLSFGENTGFGAGQGEGVAVLSTAGTGFVFSGAPAWAAKLTQLPPPAGYAYLPAGVGLNAGAFGGMNASRSGPLSLDRPLTYWLVDAGIPGSGGRMRPAARTEPQYQWFGAFGEILADDAVAGARVHQITVPAPPRPFDGLSLRTGSDSDPAGPMTGESVLLFQRLLNDLPTGASHHSLAYMGSKSLRDMALALQGSSDEGLSLYFSLIRLAQGPDKHVLIHINSGVNDRQLAAQASVGPLHVLPGDSGAAYADNLGAIIARIEQVWALNGWDVAELYYLSVPSHAVEGVDASGDDAKLRSYRLAAAGLAVTRPRMAVVDLAGILPSWSMSARRYYLNVFDHNHLSRCGYLGVSRMELSSLVGVGWRPPDFTPAGAAAGAVPLICGTTVSDSTEWPVSGDHPGMSYGAGAAPYFYTFGDDSTGNEVAYAYDAAGERVTFTLRFDPGVGELNLYVLDAAARPDHVVGYAGNDGFGELSVSLADAPHGRYHVVVETQAPLTGCVVGVPFTLTTECTMCLSDFDGSGGTPDVADIDAFFAGWLAGDAEADVDGSGGVPDANDAADFFVHWLAGC